MRWVMQEEKESERASVVALDSRWNALALGELPPCLAYLLLECGTVAGDRVALGWFDGAVGSCGAASDGVVLAGLSSEEALKLALTILAFRRRRERSLPSWRTCYQQFTNRTNRVQNRVLCLVREQVRDEWRARV